MAKAKLVTRTATTSTVTDDNLNKASALTHAEMDSNLINLRDSSFGIADDSSTVLQVTNDKTITIAGGTNITTALSGDTLTINGGAGAVTALNNATANELVTVGATTTELDAEANLTFDGTTLSISTTSTNDALLITATEDSSTAAPVITLKRNSGSPADGDYLGQIKFKGENDADQEVVYAKITGKISDNTDTTEDGLIEYALMKDGSNNIGMRLTSSDLKLLNGTGLTSNGNISSEGSITATTTIGNDAITIDDNKITASRSNDNLFISANGTGAIHIAGDDSNLFDSTLYSNMSGTPNRANTILATVESVNAGSISERSYNAILTHNTTLTASGTSSNFRPRALHANSNLDLVGFDYTNASTSRGPVAASFFGQAENSGSSSSTLATLRGIDAGAYIQDYNNHNQDITVNNAYGIKLSNGIENAGTAALTLTNVYDYYANAYTDNQSSGSSTITNHYAFFTPGTGGTNNYAFYSASDTAESRLGTIERYRETINSLTSSSTITVDCGLAPVHTVTLGVNTQFVISNLGTGQSVTIIITQDGTGSRTASFGTDGSTAVKFAGGTPTLSTAASAIDVVTIFNDGTNFLGNLASAYAA